MSETYEFEQQVSVEISVETTDGNDVDFEIYGNVDSVEISIDTASLREMIAEELRIDIRNEIIEEIGKGANPFSMLVAFLSCVGEVYEKTQQEVRENRRGEIDHFQKEIALLMKDKATLKEHNAMLREQLSPKEESNGN